MTNKGKYKSLCQQEKSVTIFNQDWWLDSVCGCEGWDVVLVEKNNVIIAALPFFIKKKYKFKMMAMPTLTQNCGPWLREIKGKKSKVVSEENKLISELYEKLPKVDEYNSNWHYSLKNWLALYWKGFKQTTYYTYVISNISDLDSVYSDFSSSYRNKIKKAEKIVIVKDGLSIDEFYDINEKTFSRQGVEIPYSFDFIKYHDEVLSKNKSRIIFFAEDEFGNKHSALYLTWDYKSSYVHMVGEDPDFRNSGAGILLVWHAIKYTKNTLGLNTFDFEGSMMESVERVRRDCGGEQIPYFNISKQNSKLLSFIRYAKLILKKK